MTSQSGDLFFNYNFFNIFFPFLVKLKLLPCTNIKKYFKNKPQDLFYYSTLFTNNNYKIFHIKQTKQPLLPDHRSIVPSSPQSSDCYFIIHLHASNFTTRLLKEISPSSSRAILFRTCCLCSVGAIWVFAEESLLTISQGRRGRQPR